VIGCHDSSWRGQETEEKTEAELGTLADQVVRKFAEGSGQDDHHSQHHRDHHEEAGRPGQVSGLDPRLAPWHCFRELKAEDHSHQHPQQVSPNALDGPPEAPREIEEQIVERETMAKLRTPLRERLAATVDPSRFRPRSREIAKAMKMVGKVMRKKPMDIMLYRNRMPPRTRTRRPSVNGMDAISKRPRLTETRRSSICLEFAAATLPKAYPIRG